MQNIFKNKFAKNTVIQIFIGDKEIKLRKITNNNIDTNLDIVYREENIDSLYCFLRSAHDHIVQVIFSSDISFRNLESVYMSQASIKNMLLNNISENNNGINASFFSVNAINKDKISINVCDVSFSSFASTVIDTLISELKNINSIISFPQWIVSSYFSVFKSDRNKFQVAIFVVENNDFTEIIATIEDEKIICYRKFAKNSSCEKDEIIQTMEYISREKKVPLDEISIQNINENTLISFVKPMQHNIRFVSTVITERNLVFEEYNASIKIALRALCCFLFLILIFNVNNLIDLSHKISKAQKIIASVPSYIISEMNIWKNIANDKMQNINYRSITSDILKQTENSQIKFLNIEKKDDALYIKMNVLNSERGNGYSKKITSGNYKFEINVLDGEIECNGSPC